MFKECEICGSKSSPFHPIMEGPIRQYKKRENEQYFDLVKKYYYCRNCGYEFEIEDFEIMVGKLSKKLAPKRSRLFTMKILTYYQENPSKAKKVLLKLIREDSSYSV